MSVKTEKWIHAAAAAGGVVLGVMFLASGVTKLLGLQVHVEMFEAFGLPRWALIPVGLLEALSAALLFIPRTRFFGALGVCAAMLGAAAVHLASGVMPAMVFLNAALFAAAAWVASKSGTEAGTAFDAGPRPVAR